MRLLPPISPRTITAGRLLIALVAVLPILILFRDTRHGFKTALRHPMAYVLALLLAGYYLLATAAFQMAPVAEVALLLSTPPLFILAFRQIRGDAPARAEIGGALVSMGGMAMILVPKISFAGDLPLHHLYGNIIAICAAALIAFYAYIYRILAKSGSAPETSGVALLTFVSGGTFLVLLLSAMPTPSGLMSLNEDTLFVLLGLGVFSTALPTIGFALASRHLPAIITATISLFIPVFAGLFAFLILGESLSLMFMVGCIFVLGGVWVIIRQGRSKASD